MSTEESQQFLSTPNKELEKNPPVANNETHPTRTICNWKLCAVLMSIIISITIWLSFKSNNATGTRPIYPKPIHTGAIDLKSRKSIINHSGRPIINRIKEFDHENDRSINILNNITLKTARNTKNRNKDRIIDNSDNVKKEKNDNHNININHDDNATDDTTPNNSIISNRTTAIIPTTNTVRNTDNKELNKLNNDVLFEWDALDVDSSKHEHIHILKTDITSLFMNETVSEKELNSNFFGPYSWHIKYPKSDSNKYSVNEILKYCFYFKLDDNEYNINGAQIDIIFNEFKLESGFDRIIIRHFNESFIDPPISFVGKEYDFDLNKYPNGYHSLLNSMNQKHFLYRNESKTICIEFQSDDSIVDKGFDMNINIKYDVCKWTEWRLCKTLNLIGIKWTRGPMSNGKCGVGVTGKSRIIAQSSSNSSSSSSSSSSGYIQCTTEKGMIGPEFCIKAPCGNYDLSKDTNFPPRPEPGWMWYNASRYYNGVGRYDPVYPDPFRLYLSENNHASFKDISNSIDILLNDLQEKMLNISNDHYHPNVLKYGIQDPVHKEKTAEYLGARVSDSLLIGRPFIMDVTGDSVTSGHDNMQESTYAMQTQSRLREFFVKYGVKGSSFQVRNIAEGGGPSSNTQGFMPIPMSTENYDYFSGLYKRMNEEIMLENGQAELYDDEDEYRFVTAGFPVRNIDILTWEFHFTDGKAGKPDRELHLREGAVLNAIWGIVEPINGIRVSESCRDWKQVAHDMELSPWKGTGNGKHKWHEIMPRYVESDALGTVLIAPDVGMHGACNILLNGTIVSDKKYGDTGDLYPGQMYGYTSYWLKANWHPNTRGHRIMADVISYWILESSYNFLQKYKSEMIHLNDYRELYIYLKNKSGNWGNKILKSITSRDVIKARDDAVKDDMFIRPSDCGVPNGECISVPFALTSYKPQTFNTHFKLRDYIMNKVPFDDIESHLGWKLLLQNTIVSMETKTGAPGNMDMLYHFTYDVNFYLGKYREYNPTSQGKPTRDEMNEFEKWLIMNKLYLQFKVLVPKYGNGTVALFHQFECEKNAKDIGNKEYVHRYIANINDDGVGEMMQNISISQCKFQGLKTGEKYKLSIVPYNIWDSVMKWQFGFIIAY